MTDTKQLQGYPKNIGMWDTIISCRPRHLQLTHRFNIREFDESVRNTVALSVINYIYGGAPNYFEDEVDMKKVKEYYRLLRAISRLELHELGNINRVVSLQTMMAIVYLKEYDIPEKYSDVVSWGDSLLSIDMHLNTGGNKDKVLIGIFESSPKRPVTTRNFYNLLAKLEDGSYQKSDLDIYIDKKKEEFEVFKDKAKTIAECLGLKLS